MNKFVGIMLLVAWIPFVIAVAFQEEQTMYISDAFYMITGLIWIVFGTWAGILLVKDSK